MAKKDTGLFVSAAGWMADFFGQIQEALIAEGITEEEIRSLVTRKPRPKLAIDKIAGGIAELIRTLKKVFTITCEGAHKTSELIKLGKYDWSNDLVTDERFPIEKHPPVQRVIELVEFDHDPTSEDVLAELERRGLERPTHEDGLYFGIQHSDEQRKRPIVFLHEPVQGPIGSRLVLVLDEGAGGRDLDLRCFDYRWFRDCVFAGVRK